MKLFLKNKRLSFPDLLVAVQYEGKGPFRYNATLLVEPDTEDDARIKAAIKAAADERYGKKAEKLLQQWEGNSQKFCYLDGNDKTYEGYEGMMYLAMHRKSDDGPPLLFDRQRNILSQHRLSSDGKPVYDPSVKAVDGVIYAGCFVNGSVEIYAQGGQNPGIRCGFSGIQFFAVGDAFSGGAPADPNEFEEYEVPEGAVEDLV